MTCSSLLSPPSKSAPGGAGRTILDQATNETNVEIDLAMQGTASGASARRLANLTPLPLPPP